MNPKALALVALIALATSQPGLCAEPELRPEWATTCKFGSIDFFLQFKSKSGDPTEDDQTVTLRWGKGRAAALPIPPALFVPGKFVSDGKNYCRDIGAFDWPNGKLLLLLPKNGRPSNDHLVAVIIDSQTGSFVQNGGDLGAHWNAVWVIKQGTGYRVLLERDWYLDVTGGGEFPAPDWMQIYEVRGRFANKWETSRK